MENKEFWIHTADTQLGAVHWQNPIREKDYYEMFVQLCTVAAEDPLCKGIIGAGDLRERASIHAKNLDGFTEGLSILAEANKPLLALMGNHDATTPNWIESFRYPSLKNLTCPKIQEKYGFDPEKTLALDFTSKTRLHEKIAGMNPEKKELVFLHQALKEFTTSIHHSHDTSLPQLESLGLGKEKPCLILLGDLHNYGDTQYNNLTAIYPGSPEMTDINEGSNGLKSDRFPLQPHDYRKFYVIFNPKTLKWSPVEIKNVRPWFCGKAKTEKEAEKLEDTLLLEASAWESHPKAACIHLSLPKTKISHFKDILKELHILEARVEEYNEEINTELTGEITHSLSWKQNKENLLSLAGESELDLDSIKLLETIIQNDGSTHNPKNDVLSAWNNWIKK
jgi:DNA repair exonuclease SbcCD nuclease subunit